MMSGPSKLASDMEDKVLEKYRKMLEQIQRPR